MSFQKTSKFNYSDLQEFANNSRSIAQFCVAMGIKPVGSNYLTAKRLLQKHNIDTEHWTGQSWGKDVQKKDWSKYFNSRQLKKILIRERTHQCEKCKNTKWFDLPITLELEHVDGDRTNNDKSNLKLLCPNCHSQTPTWRRQKHRLVRKVGVEPTT